MEGKKEREEEDWGSAKEGYELRGGAVTDKRRRVKKKSGERELAKR